MTEVTMSEQIDLQAFLVSLPEVDTSRLPVGTLFTADQLIYRVTETGAGGFHKARQWRKGEETDVALVPGSFLAGFLPLVARGRLLPVFPSRSDLLHNNESLHYLFQDEAQALDAAYLDVALVQSGDAYVRNHYREPGFAATDGVHVYRVYYYSRSVSGRATFDDFAKAKTIQFVPYSRGPMYWRLLPTWRDMSASTDETVPTVRPGL
jgi:hypothetical protein